MAIKSDKWIRRMAEQHGMIEPFVPTQIKERMLTEVSARGHSSVTHTESGVPMACERLISYGTSSYGYDVRCADEFKVFTNVNSAVVDPKNFDPSCFVDVKADEVIIPPNSFALARTVEYFRIPRDVLVICLGKSTYARCFAGNTKVALVDGRTLTLKQMAKRAKNGERFWGYTINKDGSIGVEELKNPRKTATDQELVSVELDTGERVHCTPDHKFMLRDGSYKEAQHLERDDSLMPLYRYEARGYEMVYDPKNAHLVGTHRLADEWNLRNKVYAKGNVPEHRHHVDHNRRNNNPTNIQRIPATEHILHHNADKFNDPGYLKFHSRRIRQVLKGKMKDPEFRKNWSKVSSDKALAFWHNEEYAEARERLSEARKAAWTDERREAARARMAARAKDMRAKSSGRTRTDLNDKVVRKALKRMGTIAGAAEFLDCSRNLLFRRFRHVIHELQQQGRIAVNHKVVKVRRLKKRQDVYCVTVPNTHNFALECGVFVHNCGIIVNVTPLEPEWHGHVTLEFSNTTPLPAKIYANEGVAQMLFLQSDEACETSYADRMGKYQGQTGVVPPRV